MTAALALAVLSGIMNGTFTLPMRFLDRWSWENVWSVFIVTSCLALPFTMLLLSSPGILSTLHGVPSMAIYSALGCGFAWGFGAILFGQGVSAIGISLANSLVLGLSSSLGSLLPLWILSPEMMFQTKGKLVIAGTVIVVVGVSLCGIAGYRRESEQPAGERRMVGKQRSLGIGLILCIGSGILSGVFNIGYALATPLVDAARTAGAPSAFASNLVWILMLGAGAIANLVFCGILLVRKGSFRKFTSVPAPGSAFALAVAMGLLWGGSIYVYGGAASMMGRLGPAVGWPISLAVGLIVANGWGFGVGEWRGAAPRTVRTMFAGILVLLAAVAVLGASTRYG